MGKMGYNGVSYDFKNFELENRKYHPGRLTLSCFLYVKRWARPFARQVSGRAIRRRSGARLVFCGIQGARLFIQPFGFGRRERRVPSVVRAIHGTG